MKKVLLFLLSIIFNFTLYSQCVTLQNPSPVTSNGATLNWTINDPNTATFNVKWRKKGCTTSWNGDMPFFVYFPSNIKLTTA